MNAHSKVCRFKGKKICFGKGCHRVFNWVTHQDRQSYFAHLSTCKNLCCSRCTEWGHAASRCPSARCFRCGRTGHVDYVCEYLRRNPEVPAVQNNKRQKKTVRMTSGGGSQLPNFFGAGGGGDNSAPRQQREPVIQREDPISPCSPIWPGDSPPPTLPAFVDLSEGSPKTPVLRALDPGPPAASFIPLDMLGPGPVPPGAHPAPLTPPRMPSDD